MWNAQSSGRWSPHQMFLDWFGLYGSQRDRLERSCWLSTLMKDWGIMGWIKSRRDCINVSPASLCILDECFRLGYIMGKWWAVACEYWLINRCTAGVMTFFPHFINFSHVRANSARMLLCSALTEASLNMTDWLPTCLNHHRSYGRCEQVLNGQYSKMSDNRASTICGFLSMVI